MMEDDKGNKIIERLIDKIFEIKKNTFYLIIIFLLGLILRLIAAINLSVTADDMHFVVHAINFFSSGRLVTYDQSSGLWFSFTDVIYKLFGMSQLTSRLASIIFGSLSILAIYLLTKEFFNEKVSIISAFLFAIAPFHISNTIAEMDVTAMFFVLLGSLLFIRALKKNKNGYYIVSGIFFGLAIYTKVYPLLFIPSILLYFVYFNWKSHLKIISKENIKKILIFIIFAFIFALPALTHNYLLYKDRGFLDLQFTRTLGLGKDISAQYYAWDGQFSMKNSWKGLIFGDSQHIADGTPLLIGAVSFVSVGDPIIFYLGVIGIALVFFRKKEHRNYLIFFILSILFALPFLASIILLPKHYLFLEILLIPIGSFTLNEMIKKISALFNKDVSKLVLSIFLIIMLIFLGMPNAYSIRHVYGESYIGQTIDFKNSDIPKNSLIVSDSRIYRGNIHWISQGRPYLEGVEFVQLINAQDQFPGDIIPIDIYYIECVVDDCGWGTIKDQPEFNESMESLTDFFKQNGQLVKAISEPDRYKPYYSLILKENKNVMINIYNLKIQMKNSVLEIAKQPKKWFLYDIGYLPKEKQFDYYETSGFFAVLLDKIAHWIVLIALVLALLSPLYVIYLVYKT